MLKLNAGTEPLVWSGVSILTSPDVGLAQIARPRVEQEADELQEGEDTEDVTPSDDSEVEEEAE